MPGMEKSKCYPQTSYRSTGPGCLQDSATSTLSQISGGPFSVPGELTAGPGHLHMTLLGATCYVTKLLGRHTSTHPRYRTHNRPNLMNTTKVQLSESVSFIGIIYRNMGEVTYNSRNDFNSCTSKPTPSMGDSSQAHCICRGQNQQVWRGPFTVASDLFQQA